MCRVVGRKLNLDLRSWPVAGWSLFHGRLPLIDDRMGPRECLVTIRRVAVVNGGLVALRRPPELRLVATEEPAQRLHPDGWPNLAAEPTPDFAVAYTRSLQAILLSEAA